ncbi:MAG: RDD family protein [Candidatus Binatia bacterium]
MIDPLPCPSCSFANALGAESCVKCGTALAETPERPHPGETLRDPDDLTLPPSPLLRAVLRGEPDAATRLGTAAPPSPSASAPQPRPMITRASAEHLSPTADQAALLRDLAERLQTRAVVEPEPAGRLAPQPAAISYAGFFVRVAAFLIDGVVLGLFALPLAAAGYCGLRAGFLVLGRSVPIVPDEAILEALIIAWFVMATIYFTALHRSHGQTIGKSLLGLHVRSLHLDRLGIFRSLLRTLGYAASSSFFGFGFILVALTPRKRGWHDFLAGTCVVRGNGEEVSA